MSEFLASYGLWLLVALLIVVVVAWLLLGRKKADTPEPIQPPAPAPKASVPPAQPAPTPKPVPAPQPVATPAPVAAPAPEPVASAAPAADDLLLLKGVGPKLNAVLKEQGVTSFAQIAAWTDADIATIDPKLGTFQGRPVRDHWVDQAKYLAAGDIPGFEAKYGKI